MQSPGANVQQFPLGLMTAHTASPQQGEWKISLAQTLALTTIQARMLGIQLANLVSSLAELAWIRARARLC